jgi:hypothetical protein
MSQPEAVPKAIPTLVAADGTGIDLGALTRSGATFAALAYATGMVTINTYLHKLGITDFSFARPKLILTGVLVLLSFLLLALLPIFVVWRMMHRQPLTTVRRSKKILVLLLFPLAALFAASAWLCFGTEVGLGQITVWGIWELLKQRNVLTETLASLIIAAEVYLPICVAALSSVAAFVLYKRAKSAAPPPELVGEKLYIPIAAALAVIAVCGYIYIFSLTFYAAIPQAFGGGKPYFESLVISESGRCQLQQLGIPFLTTEPNVTEPLPILHESDTLVAVWLQKQAKASEQAHSPTEHEGDWSTIVVQIDKIMVSATMAYPRASQTPQLQPTPISCKAAAAQ